MGCECRLERSCIERVPIFSALSQEEMTEVAAIIIRKEYKKGEMIHLSGDKGRLYIIHTGKVKMYRLSEAGKELIIRILEPGDFMGELSLFTHAPINSCVEAMESTRVCTIDGDKLSDIINKYPGIALKIIEELGKRLQHAEDLVETLGLHDVQQKVADMLLRISNGKAEIELSMTKKDMAAQMGMSQETLSRKLSEFQSMGLIKQIGYRRIVIIDRHRLVKMAAK